MRMKKFLLLYCSDREWLQAMAYALRVHGYDVTATIDLKEALALAAGKDTAICAAVLLHAQQGDPTGRLLHLLLESESHVPLLLVDRVGDLSPVRYANMVLYGRNTSMVHVLGALKILCARKRNPQPRSES